MRVAVFGSNGQVGRAFVAQTPPGTEVIGFTRAQCDLADGAAIDAALRSARPDIIVNCAAYTAVDRAESEPDLAFAINRDAVAAMAGFARQGGAHLIHLSTDFVFDGSQARPYSPGDARNPLSVYGRSKAEGEDVAGPEATIVRTSWVHGAEGANFVRTMLRVLRERDEVRVVADQIGCPTATSTLARVLWAFAQMRQPGLFHCSDAGAASWYDFAVAIAEEGSALGLIESSARIVPIATADYPTPAVRPGFSLLDPLATYARLAIEPVHWREALRATLQDISENG